MKLVYSQSLITAPVVQWIELRTSKPQMLVRFQPGAQFKIVLLFFSRDFPLLFWFFYVIF